MNCSYNPYTLPTIDFIGGSTQELVFHSYSMHNKGPIDLSSCTANFSIINFVNKHGAPIFSKQMQILLGNDKNERVQNILKVILRPLDTVDLEGKFIYQISIRDITGETEVPQGILYIFNNINKQFVR